MKPEDRIKELLNDCHSEGRFALPINLASAVIKIAEFTEAAIADERKRLRTILGFDVETEGECNGEKYRICHDPYYNLDAAVDDLTRQKADEVCIKTIKEHQAKLIAFDKATKPPE